MPLAKPPITVEKQTTCASSMSWRAGGALLFELCAHRWMCVCVTERQEFLNVVFKTFMRKNRRQDFYWNIVIRNVSVRVCCRVVCYVYNMLCCVSVCACVVSCVLCDLCVSVCCVVYCCVCVCVCALYVHACYVVLYCVVLCMCPTEKQRDVM